MIEKVIIPAAVSLIGGVNAINNSQFILNCENPIDEIKNISEQSSSFVSENLEKAKDKILTKKEIEDRVVKIIIDKLGVVESEVTQNASFTNDLGADSLDTVELIMEFEKEFNIAIPDAIAERINTVGQSVDYINEVLNYSVILYSDIKYSGKTMRFISNYSPYWSNSEIIEGGVSSIKIPKGYILTLHSEIKYSGSKIIIDATKKSVKIKDLSKVKKRKNISISGDIENWNDMVKSVRIEKN